MINISNLSIISWFISIGIFFLIITIIIFPFVIFKVHRDIEKQYCVSINYPAYTKIVYSINKYFHLAFHVFIFYLYSISNSKLLKKIFLMCAIRYSFLNEFNYNVKEEKKSNIIICAGFYTSAFLFGAFSICAGFMISPTWIWD